MKKFTLFLSAILISAMSFAAALGEGYSKVTDITTLAAGDKVVVYCDDASLGVTGWNGTKDATVAAEGWVEYVVEAAEGGVLLKDGDNYIALTAKNGFYYNATGSVCKVNAAGVLYCTLNDVDYFFYENGGNYYRMYTDKTDNSAYKPFYVYEVVVAEPEPEPEPAGPQPRAWAYDLQHAVEGENHTFSFKATAAANATLIFADEAGAELATIDLGAVVAGANSKVLAASELPVGKKVKWSVKMVGKAITELVEITDQTKGIYDFYNMMDVVVDNDPESEDFGKIYIQQSLNGDTDGSTERADKQTAGLFIYDQELNELNPTSNVGILPTLPEGYTIGDARNNFHRLQINPKTGDLVFCYNVSGKPAVFAIDRENMTGMVTNMVEGIKGLSRTAAHCFDENGALYVMDLPSAGTIYKIVDSVATVFSASDAKFVNASMTLEYDGNGGIWVAQNRGQIDSYYQLAHISSTGVIDWSVYSNTTSTHNMTGSSTRGAMAYDAKNHLLAQGRNEKVEVYSVSYDATTGVPSLTHIITTPKIGTNIDGIAFDYAGDLYVVNSSKEKFQKFVLPTTNNTCITPAAAKYAFELEAPTTSVEMVGVVKRALQLGDTTIVLTHEADGTPHIYTVAGEAIAEVSQEGIVAKDPDNAGDYLTISDIALTEDGKLVACNYVRTQFDASYIESGYKRGTLHLYVWNDIKGAASIWFESMFTANSLRGDCGYTMAVNGTVANANILVTAVHNSHRGVRMSHYSVVDGAYVEPNYASGIYDNHLFYVGAKFKGASAGSEAATFNEATHGVNFQLNASPLAESNWVMDSEGLMPTEFGVASQQDPSIVGAVAETLVSKALVGAYYVTVGDKKVMVAPYADAEGKLAGVKLLDITAGFANAAPLTTAESLDLTAPVAATGVATTAVVESNGTLTINLIADATIYTMTATIQESPSTSLEENNVQNDIIKFYQNGQVYIMVNGVVYNVMGQMVK